MDTKDRIELLATDALDLFEARIDLWKLKAIDKTSNTISSFAWRLVLLLIAGCFILMVNIGLALWIGELLGKNYYGFFVMSGIYTLAGVLFFIYRKTLIKVPVSNIIIRKFLNI